MNLQDKVAIVTGGSSGIGRAIAKRLSSEGCRVAICFNSNEDRAQKLANELDPTGDRTILFGGDLSEPANAKNLFDATIAKFSQTDILVNCAGGVIEQRSDPNEALEITDWHKTFAANLYATVTCTDQARKHMQPGSKIVNVGSVLGDRFGGREMIPAYSAAKAAVHNFTQTMAKELVPDILMNCVSPGRTITEAYDGLSKADKDALGAVNKIDRWIQPDEIADAVAFIARNDAIVGEVVSVDAGFFL